MRREEGRLRAQRGPIDLGLGGWPAASKSFVRASESSSPGPSSRRRVSVVSGAARTAARTCRGSLRRARCRGAEMSFELRWSRSAPSFTECAPGRLMARHPRLWGSRRPWHRSQRRSIPCGRLRSWTGARSPPFFSGFSVLHVLRTLQLVCCGGADGSAGERFVFSTTRSATLSASVAALRR